MLAASAIAMPSSGTVELCTATGIRRVAAPFDPEAPTPMPDCAKVCHFGTTRRKLGHG